MQLEVGVMSPSRPRPPLGTFSNEEGNANDDGEHVHKNYSFGLLFTSLCGS